jgi:hypothetical protein
MDFGFGNTQINTDEKKFLLESIFALKDQTRGYDAASNPDLQL